MDGIVGAVRNPRLVVEADVFPEGMACAVDGAVAVDDDVMLVGCADEIEREASGLPFGAQFGIEWIDVWICLEVLCVSRRLQCRA